MRSVSIAEAENGLNALLDAVQSEAVTIQRKDGDGAVLLSQEDYDRITGANVKELKELCAVVSREAAERGLTEEKLAEILNE